MKSRVCITVGVTYLLIKWWLLSLYICCLDSLEQNALRSPADGSFYRSLRAHVNG